MCICWGEPPCAVFGEFCMHQKVLALPFESHYRAFAKLFVFYFLPYIKSVSAGLRFCRKTWSDSVIITLFAISILCLIIFMFIIGVFVIILCACVKVVGRTAVTIFSSSSNSFGNSFKSAKVFESCLRHTIVCYLHKCSIISHCARYTYVTQTTLLFYFGIRFHRHQMWKQSLLHAA